MKSKIFILILGVFLIGFVSSIGVCIDHDAPTWPENSTLDLSVVNDNDVYLDWTNATDIPECSGIDHYDIYRGEEGGNLTYFETSFNNSFLDKNLSYGTYEYMIHAYDKVNHTESNVSILNSITLKKPSNGGNGGNGGGGGGGSFTSLTSVWECSDWSECINGTQRRVCEDLKGYKDNKTEIKNCSIELTSPDKNINKSGGKGNISSTDRDVGFFTGFATALLGEENQGKTLSYIGVIVLILALIIFLIRKRKPSK